MRKLLHITLLILLSTMVSLTAKADEVTLTNANIVGDGSRNQSYRSWTITDNNGKTWNAYAIKNYHSNATKSNHFLQIKKYDNDGPYYIQIPEYGSKITSITMQVSRTTAAMGDAGNTATLFFSNSNSTSASGTGVASGTGSGSVTIDCSDLDLNTGYITASGAVRIWNISVTYTTTSTNKVVKPTFDPAAGEVASGTEVSFNCTTEGVTYYFTTDGTDPTTYSSSGSSYTVNNNVTLKVMAVKNGMDNSDVATAVYTIAKTDPNLAFSETSVIANYGEDFTPPTLTYAEGYDGTITYSSSNSAISVDPTTGEISFDASAIGKTTTITATASET